MKQITQGIYPIEGLKTGRSYIIEDRDGITLIDTSTGGVAHRILAAIAAIGRWPEDVHTIVATHYHFDHTGNVDALAESTHAQFCVHAEDVPYVDGRKPWMPMRVPFGRLVDRVGPAPYRLDVGRGLRDGEVLPTAGGLEVVHLPGHTPGNIGLYARERGVMFTGDTLMNVIGLRLPLSMSTHDPEQAKRSVKRLAEFDFEIALPGHGNPVLGRASEKIREWARCWL